MRARDILSKNLRALIDHARETNPKLGAIRKVAEASGGKLTNGTVGRIAAGSHTTDIDALADLAEVFGLQPWQLLVEDLNPRALPRLVDPLLLEQIKELVGSAPVATGHTSSSPADKQPVKRTERAPVKIGPALQEVFDQRGSRKNANSTAGSVPKQKGRGRR